MLLVDCHAHMDFEDYNEDLAIVIERCKTKGVKVIINNAVHRKSMGRILALSKEYDIIKPAFGVYPAHAVEMNDEEFTEALEFIKANKPVAIGEIGLDYLEVKEPDRELMETRFREQIRLAKKLKIPVIVHSRKAEERTIEVLEEEKADKVLMHCFSGRKSLVKRIVKNGWSLSIPANVVRAEHFRMIIKETPAQQLLTETDSPLLGPVVGERNEPWNVIEGIKAIAEINGLDENETANMIFSNYQRLF